MKGLIGLNRREIELYLEMLGRELMAQGKQGSILLLGGVVMLVRVGNRTATHDIDAVFDREKSAIYKAAKEIAEREGLPDDWINEAAKVAIRSHPPAILWKQYPGLDVYMPKLEYILAMKIEAGRAQDRADARAIAHLLGLSQQEIFDILEQYIPQRSLTARMQYTVEDWFD